MRAVLAVRDFRLLWLSQVGSTLADGFVLIMLALQAVRSLTGTCRRRSARHLARCCS